ncbi:MAG: RNA 3'-terminal phosphate cyclase [Spirochaetes bacterium]|nr:RNA 3'-terminal phosphate cyclase [Spirochaetota bacterium]
MIIIDGSFGEGGGQILRTSLSLSLITKKPFEIRNIRANRSKPGLLRQHLTAIEAAKTISQAQVGGAALGSSCLVFEPGKVQGGNYRFSVGTAGSTILVLQTILPALLITENKSEILLEGGTHNPFAPPYDFMEDVFFGYLRKMGAEITSQIEQYGFFPAGGGRIKTVIHPAGQLKPLHFSRRKKIIKQTALAYSNLIPDRIGQQEMIIISRALNINKTNCKPKSVPSPGPGNAVIVKLESDQGSECFTAFGEKRKPLEKVCQELINQVEEFYNSDGTIGHYLADQLLIPLAMAGSGSYFTSQPSQHTLTNIEIIQKFLDIPIRCQAVSETTWQIHVGG